MAESRAKLPQDVFFVEGVIFSIDTAPGSRQRVGTEAPATMENSDTLPDTTSRPAADPRSEYPFTPDTEPQPETDPRSQFPFTDVPEPEAGFVPAPEATAPAPAAGQPVGVPVGSYPAAPAPRVEVDMMVPPFSSDPPAALPSMTVDQFIEGLKPGIWPSDMGETSAPPEAAAPAPELESGFDIQEPAPATGPLDESEPEL